MEYVVECNNLTHYYGKKLVYKDMSFKIKKGSIFGLLGKNGTGKTTTINILNGYLTPTSGQCLVFGEDSQHLSPKTKERIGFLMEGHIQYNFMNIHQIEKFYSAFYPRWNKDAYYELMSRLNVSPGQKIAKMSCGQRSQVALGLILAQDPDLMILDDYSMGLDAGYRRLFLDYLKEYAKAENKTIFVTSHIIQDLEGFIDDCVFLGYTGVILSMPVDEFQRKFKRYDLELESNGVQFSKNDVIKNFEIMKNHATIYSFNESNHIKDYLNGKGIHYSNLRQVPMTLEDSFIGLTGKY